MNSTMNVSNAEALGLFPPVSKFREKLSEILWR